MPAETVRMAVIGCGRIAGHHCRRLLEVKGARVAAVCDLVEEKAGALGREIGVPFFTNYHEMLKAHPDINVVVIATPSGMHAEHAQDVLKRYRRNVVVEKPTFMRPSQLTETYELAKSLGLHVFPVFQNRHNRAVSRVRKAILDGELGAIRIMAVRVRWCRPQRYYDLAPWRGTFAQDGGALTNQGIHHVDLLRYLGGEVQAVNATMRTLGAKIEVEDTAVATMTYSTGAVGVLEVTTSARPDDFEASLSVVCDKGLAQLGGIAVNELQIFTPDPSACAQHSEDFSRNVYGLGHAEVYKQIVGFFEKGEPFSVDREDCSKTIGLLHAFYRSDEARGWVDVAGGAESARLGRPDEELAKIYRTPLPKESS
jgi:UDP-N-acetyl-2-amino-2-deoxyglucuronate dehydrogenase